MPEKTYEILIWDTASGQAVQTLKTDAGEIQGMAFSPDGKMLAVALVNLPGADGGTLQVWNTETGGVAQSMTLGIPPGQTKIAVNGTAFSSDGTLVGIINQDSAFVWELRNGELKTQRNMAPVQVVVNRVLP